MFYIRSSDLIIKKTRDKCWCGCEERGIFFVCGNVNSHCERQYGGSSKNYKYGNSLAVQWLELSSFTVWTWIQSLGRELRSHKPHDVAKKKKKKVRNRTTVRSGNPTSGYISKKIWKQNIGEIYVLSCSFVITKIWKQHEHPWVGEWIKMWYMFTMSYLPMRQKETFAHDKERNFCP